MDDIRSVRKPAILMRNETVSSAKKMMSLDSPSVSKRMTLTKTNRCAIIASLSMICSHSQWIPVPIDGCGYGYVFARRKAATLFGKHIRTADLFSFDGNASRLATEIICVATIHGWIAHSVGKTCCPHMQGAFEAMAFPDAGLNLCIQNC